MIRIITLRTEIEGIGTQNDETAFHQLFGIRSAAVRTVDEFLQNPGRIFYRGVILLAEIIKCTVIVQSENRRSRFLKPLGISRNASVVRPGAMVYRTR